MPDISPRPEGTVTDLASAVDALRFELDHAAGVAKHKALRFNVSKVTMNFSVEVTADAEAHAGVKFWVVDVGASGGLSRTTGHTVTLELTPTTSAGRHLEIADDE